MRLAKYTFLATILADSQTKGQLVDVVPKRLRQVRTVASERRGDERGSSEMAPEADGSAPRSLGEQRNDRIDADFTLHELMKSMPASMSLSTESSKGPDKIVGGQPLNRGERPYLVSVMANGRFGCTATLIAPTIVLSAAHCFMWGDTFFPAIFALSIDINRYDLTDDVDDEGIISYDVCPTEFGSGCDLSLKKLAFVVTHQDFKQGTDTLLASDYALVFLPEPITNISPLKLNTNPSLPVAGDLLEASGWGLLSGNSMVPSDVPHAVNMNYMTSMECTDIWQPLQGFSITSEQLCADADGASTCRGDSGGPIILNTPEGPVQVGITSFSSSGCPPIGSPAVFARISAGMEWITDTACEHAGQWCDVCVDLEDESTVEDTSDYDVDLLPGFIEEMVNSGVLIEEEGHYLVKPKKEKKAKEVRTKTMEDGLPAFIIGADSELEEKKRPYLVSFGLQALAGVTSPTGHFCAGTLIAPNVVLSAAYCFSDVFGNKVKLDFVEFSRNDLYTDPGVARIYLKKSDIWLHPKYNPVTLENNIALVFLSHPMVGIEPVKLNKYPGIPTVTGDTLEVFGWGATSRYGLASNLPRTLSVGYVQNDKCSELFELKPSMICAAKQGVDGPCDYDWGNPLIKDTPQGPIQVGVFSTGSCNIIHHTLPNPPLKTPPCDKDEKLLNVVLETDRWPVDTSWILKNLCTGCIQQSISQDDDYSDENHLYSHDYCVPDAEYEFTIFDSSGDGINSDDGYQVTYDKVVVAHGGGNFGRSETSDSFGTPAVICNPDPSCQGPFPDHPSIYSRVDQYVDWIERTVECKSKAFKKGSKSGKTSSKSGKQLV